MANFETFTHQYALQKTLRFALEPVGQTETHIREKGLLEKDEGLAQEYKNAKKIIDAYHRDFIERQLADFRFDESDLRDFADALDAIKAEKSDKSGLQKKLEAQQERLRKKVAEKLREDNFLYEKGEKKLEDFIKITLPEFLETSEIAGVDNPLATIAKFKGWTTYFYGFNENRKNMYTHEAHSTAIAYRIVHENLPRFLANTKRYNKAKKLGVDFSGVESPADLDEVFSLSYFNRCLNQEGINAYNAIRGGRGRAASEREQGINEKINLHSQQIEDKSEKRAVNSCKLEKLHKQILSDAETDSFRFDEIKYDAGLCEKIAATFQVKADGSLWGLGDEAFSISNGLGCLANLDGCDPAMLYVRSAGLNGISREMFKDWGVIKRALERYAEVDKFPVDNKTSAKKREKWLKQSYFSFDEVHNALAAFFTDEYGEAKFSADEEADPDTMAISEQYKLAMSKPLYAYFGDANKVKSLLSAVGDAHNKAAAVFDDYRQVKKRELKSKKDEVVAPIKEYLDAIMDVHHFIKPLYVQTKEKEADVYEKDSGFYDAFESLYDATRPIVPLYNQTRNYLTQKPYSIEKYKLNFDTQTLAAGWAKGREDNNRSVLFMKDGNYYLGIIAAGQSGLFGDDATSQPDGNNVAPVYQKMVYHQIADAGKDIQTLVEVDGQVVRKTKGLDDWRKKHAPEIARIKKSESHMTTKERFSKDDLSAFIAYYQKMAKGYWRWCDFAFKEPGEYDSFKDFTDDVNRQGYRIDFQSIAADYIDRCVANGKLYLFHIYSKDFSPKTRGKPNLNTVYFKMLFDKSNLDSVVYKLNGSAQLFHRNQSIEHKPSIWEKGHHAETKKQPYPIIKDRRYARDTYLFHFSVTINFQSPAPNKLAKKHNMAINRHLQGNESVKILGIDRGERHLAYYTLIDQNGDIKEHGSFNNPFGDKDYHALLDTKEGERDAARRSWQTIENIKDLKAGYLSQVVHKICQMVVDHNAIVVFEDLNFGFKRGRMKIEKQVYQKLEKMLIDKLNFLVFKDRAEDEIGGALAGYQLAAPFVSFQAIGKQTGVIFYVPPYHTSKVCPATGFVDLIYPRYETVEKSQTFFDKFEKIVYNRDAGHFEFHIDSYDKLTQKTAEGVRQDWVICARGARLENKRQKNGQWDSQLVDLSDELGALFDGARIDYGDGGCIKGKIVAQCGGKFFRALLRLLRLTLQMRNSKIGTDEDWLISPIRDENGEFFDSRADGCRIPNADANGAYHIALKGLWCLRQIAAKGADIKPGDLNIKNKDWYQFVQNKSFKKESDK